MDFLSSEFVKLTMPLLAAVIAWYINEHRKRAWEEYVRKEQGYRELLNALRGFYAQSEDAVSKQRFLDQVNQCWLYCPDEVIRAAYAFLYTVKVGAESSESNKSIACGNLVAAIRTDMLKRRIVAKTKLTGRDFEHFRST